MENFNDVMFENTEGVELDDTSNSTELNNMVKPNVAANQEEATPDITEQTVQEVNTETSLDTEPVEPVSEKEQWAKAYQNMESQRDTFKNELKQERENLAKEIAELKSQLNPVVEEPQLAPPTEPVRPEWYDEIDAMTDRDSPSYKHRLAEEKYVRDTIKYQNDLLSKQKETYETEKQKSLEQQQYAREKAMTIGGLMKEGFSETKSNEALNFFVSKESTQPDVLTVMYDAAMAYKSGKTTAPTNTNPFNAPLPPGATPGSTEPQKSVNQAYNEATFVKKEQRTI